MTGSRTKHMLILISCVTMATTSSPTCPLPLQAKTGDQSSVRVTVFRCEPLNATAESVCTNPIFKSTLKKDLVTNLGYDNNGYALLAKFYGREICVSYRIMILSKIPGRPLESRTSCELDCFEDDKMLTIGYDSACDETKCLQEKENLYFIVNSANRRIHSSMGQTSFHVGLILVILLIK